ncbi:MAG: hypothetical protein J1E96_03860 [Ruminococcus sp.]|nr:hypothetical protein [Ruminococcus sp.]
MKPIIKYIAVATICFALCVAIIVACYYYSDTTQSYFEPSNNSTHITEAVRIASPTKSKPRKKTKKKNNNSKISQSITYILNTNTRRFHYSDCRYVDTIADHNLQISTSSRDLLAEIGYIPCKICKP